MNEVGCYLDTLPARARPKQAGDAWRPSAESDKNPPASSAPSRKLVQQERRRSIEPFELKELDRQLAGSLYRQVRQRFADD